jgi:putative transcriptional regulator
MRILAVFALLLFSPIASVIVSTARHAQSSKPQGSEPETGKPQTSNTQAQFLVSSRDLSDPFFRQSVVLMLPIKEGPLLVGIIVNKPTKFKLRDVFPDSSELQKMDAKVYFGGPVDADVLARSAIFRSKTPPKDATLIFGDVYVSFDPKAIAALAGDSQQASTLRVFLGRAQWGTAQFENEVSKGAWHTLPASADSIFTEFPETVWRILIDQTEPRPIVQSAPPYFFLADTVALLARE